MNKRFIQPAFVLLCLALALTGCQSKKREPTSFNHLDRELEAVAAPNEQSRYVYYDTKLNRPYAREIDYTDGSMLYIDIATTGDHAGKATKFVQYSSMTEPHFILRQGYLMPDGQRFESDQAYSADGKSQLRAGIRQADGSYVVFLTNRDGSSRGQQQYDKYGNLSHATELHADGSIWMDTVLDYSTGYLITTEYDTNKNVISVTTPVRQGLGIQMATNYYADAAQTNKTVEIDRCDPWLATCKSAMQETSAGSNGTTAAQFVFDFSGTVTTKSADANGNPTLEQVYNTQSAKSVLPPAGSFENPASGWASTAIDTSTWQLLSANVSNPKWDLGSSTGVGLKIQYYPDGKTPMTVEDFRAAVTSDSIIVTKRVRHYRADGSMITQEYVDSWGSVLQTDTFDQAKNQRESVDFDPANTSIPPFQQPPCLPSVPYNPPMLPTIDLF